MSDAAPMTASGSLRRRLTRIADRPVGQTAWRLGPLVAGSLAIVLLVLSLEMLRLQLTLAPGLGIDLDFYLWFTRAWVETGQLYTAHQLTGEPYDFVVMIDPLYPPVALYLFVPFLVLPKILWWVIPIATILWTVTSWRPAAWTWPLLALVLLWPRTYGAIIFGNTDLWVSAFVAGGLRWGWPAAFLIVKPTLLPIAVLVIRRRTFWIGVAGVTVASLPMIPLWLDYAVAMVNLRGASIDYSFGALPLVLLPAVAWLGRRRPTPERGADGGRPDPVGPTDQVGA